MVCEYLLWTCKSCMSHGTDLMATIMKHHVIHGFASQDVEPHRCPDKGRGSIGLSDLTRHRTPNVARTQHTLQNVVG